MARGRPTKWTTTTITEPVWLLIAGISVMLVASSAAAQQSKPIPKQGETMQEIEKLRKLNEERAALDRVMSDLEKLKQAAEAIAREKTIECVGVVGHVGFCSCLA